MAAVAPAQTLGPTGKQIEEPLSIKVERLNLVGNTALDDSVFADIVEDAEGRLMSFDDMRRLAESIVARYREHDYLTVSAYLPEQDLSDGNIEIQVVEAKIGEVSVQGVEHYDHEYLKWMFKPIIDKQDKTDSIPRRSDVQRQLLLINDNMDLSVRSIFRESDTPGIVDVVLQGEDRRPLHFTFDYNNLGATSTGRHRLGGTFEWGNFTNRADILSLRYVESNLLNADTKGIDLFSVGYTTPLNNVGTHLDVSYANSAFQAGQEVQLLDIRGSADVFRVGVRHKLIRSLEANLDLSAAYVHQNIENRILDTRFSEDRLREIILGVSGDWSAGSGRNFGSVLLTHNLSGALGGTKSSDRLASRNSGGSFTKLKFDLSRVQRLNEYSYFIVRGSHQAAFSNLPYAEQFGLGGISTVRGYDQSIFLGDSGYNLSAELRFAPIESNRELFEVGAFIDHGGAALKNPLPGEIPNGSLTGAGATFQFRLPEETFIRADIGWPLGESGRIQKRTKGPVPYLIFSKRF